MPLITGRVSIGECKPLLDKISARVQHWASKISSFAGRLQLISSVISIQNYLCFIFMLPSKFIKAVEKLCKAFLSKGKEGSALVLKLLGVVLPLRKQEGGLGPRKIKEWNVACALKNLWNLILQSGSLWVAWVSQYKWYKSTWSLRVPAVKIQGIHMGPNRACHWQWEENAPLEGPSASTLILGEEIWSANHSSIWTFCWCFGG